MVTDLRPKLDLLGASMQSQRDDILRLIADRAHRAAEYLSMSFINYGEPQIERVAGRWNVD